MKYLRNILMLLTVLGVTWFGIWCVNRSTIAGSNITAARIYNDIVTGHVPDWVKAYLLLFIVLEAAIRLIRLYYKHHKP